MLIQHYNVYRRVYISVMGHCYMHILSSDQPIIERTYALPGFCDLKYSPDNIENEKLKIDKDGLTFVKRPFDKTRPWLTTGVLRGQLENSTTTQMKEVELRPLGATILRQLTFSS